MNDRQRKFTELVGSGLAAGRAYERAGYKARGHVADSCAAKLLTNAVVVAYTKELRELAKADAVLTIQKRREFLSRAITTPLGAIDVDSDLCSEYHCGDDGSKIKKYDALRALDLLNKMDGAYAPEKIEVETSSALAELLKSLP